jgi:two-component system sensor histidine kinase/response regulator
VPDAGDVPSEGTGLGLAISRRLVEQQNGRLWVQSALGEGSRFSFSLPLGHSITFSPPLVLRIVQSRRARPLILIVDDEVTALELLRTSLLPDYQVPRPRQCSWRGS